MATDPKNHIISCPDCNEAIALVPPIDKGDRYTCPNCWADLIVANLNPIELRWNDIADTDEDDWEDE